VRTDTTTICSGGTAGCVVAARLSEDPSVSVLLLERGPIIDTWASYVPFLASDYRQASSPVYSWSSESVDALGRTMGLFSGKAMGGTSKINSAMVTWSTPGEYNAWKQQGRQGWGWEDVKDFFRKSEKSLTHTGENHRGQAGEFSDSIQKSCLISQPGPWVNQSFQETYYPWSEA
jgi:choline dehydrogenase